MPFVNPPTAELAADFASECATWLPIVLASGPRPKLMPGRPNAGTDMATLARSLLSPVTLAFPSGVDGAGVPPDWAAGVSAQPSNGRGESACMPPTAGRPGVEFATPADGRLAVCVAEFCGCSSS